ncbi:Acyl-CoA synthetase family member 3, mitochondrial [Galdieria sulphuraria]|nr:Acyl-CoA synthetase family member 3, mitochondrial [Galdieria sulphuraria]
MALSNPLKEEERRPGWVGYPLPGVQVQLKDEESNQWITEKAGRGELLIKGPNVFREYWNRPKATAAAFEKGYFLTGDIAQRDESGFYQIIGRSSVDIIKSGGYKLSALEIERVYLQHPAIQQCTCVGIKDDEWGESVGLVIVLKDGQGDDVSLEELREWGKDKLAPYKLPKKYKRNK